MQGKKHHHEIDVLQLNKVAIKRLEELQLELEALRSLKISATHRIYGYIVDQTFYILWYDDNHGDNSTCVCRSRKKIHELGILDEAHSPAMSIMDIAGLFVVL